MTLRLRMPQDGVEFRHQSQQLLAHLTTPIIGRYRECLHPVEDLVHARELIGHGASVTRRPLLPPDAQHPECPVLSMYAPMLTRTWDPPPRRGMFDPNRPACQPVFLERHTPDDPSCRLYTRSRMGGPGGLKGLEARPMNLSSTSTHLGGTRDDLD
jgi:hypothetical protein